MLRAGTLSTMFNSRRDGWRLPPSHGRTDRPHDSAEGTSRNQSSFLPMHHLRSFIFLSRTGEKSRYVFPKMRNRWQESVGFVQETNLPLRHGNCPNVDQ